MITAQTSARLARPCDIVHLEQLAQLESVVTGVAELSRQMFRHVVCATAPRVYEIFMLDATRWNAWPMPRPTFETAQYAVGGRASALNQRPERTAYARIIFLRRSVPTRLKALSYTCFRSAMLCRSLLCSGLHGSDHGVSCQAEVKVKPGSSRAHAVTTRAECECLGPSHIRV